MTGFGPGLALRHRGDALRVVYALKIGDAVWVFRKEWRYGLKMPQPSTAPPSTTSPA
jgi:hypothetical protein